MSKDNKDTEVTDMSKLPPVPEKPELQHRKAIHKYYEDNAPQIIEEIKQYGSEAIEERWKFGEITWYRFCKGHNIKLPRDGYQPRSKHDYPKNRKSAVKGTVENKKEKDTGVHDTPISFPPFSDEWPAEVQVKWLEVYKDLTIAGVINGKET